MSTEELSAKASTEDVEAQYHLGERYYYGAEDVSIDKSRAAELLKQAAEQGHAGAQATLGWMYVTGDGIPPDTQGGMEWLNKSAAQTNSVAQYYLGCFYETGRGGVEADRFEAMDWYMKAAAQGHKKAGKDLARMRKKSDAIRKGTAEPEWWEVPLDELKSLAEQGDSDAQRRLGVRYKGYGGTPVDFEKSCYWQEKAAAQTNLSAHYSLALLYTSGTNVLEEKAFQHCLAAAEGGDRDGQYLLGRYYRDGVGVDADRKEALHWYSEAERSGHVSASGSIYSLMRGKSEEFPKTGKFFSANKYTPLKPKVTFLDFDKQETTATAEGYDPETKRVKISPAIGGLDALPLSAFQKSSHPVLLDIAEQEAFEELSVRMSRTTLSRKDCEAAGKVFGRKGSSNYDYDGFSYRFVIKNRGSMAVKDISVRCYFFYEKESQISYAYGAGSLNTKIQSEACLLTNVTLEAGSQCDLETQSAILESYDTLSSVYYADGKPTLVRSDPLGLRVRLIRSSADGNTIYEDFFEKSSLKAKLSD